MTLAYSRTSSTPTITHVIKWEANTEYCRECDTILAGSGAARSLTIGMVIAKVTASGKLVQLDQDGVDGSEVAIGIAINDAAAADGADAVDACLYVARQALAKSDGLVWPADITVPEQTTALAELEALGIVVR